MKGIASFGEVSQTEREVAAADNAAQTPATLPTETVRGQMNHGVHVGIKIALGVAAVGGAWWLWKRSKRQKSQKRS